MIALSNFPICNAKNPNPTLQTRFSASTTRLHFKQTDRNASFAERPVRERREGSEESQMY